MPDNLQKERPGTGWLWLHLSDGQFSVSETELEVVEEIWLMLHQVAEVADRGRELVRRFQPSLPEGDVEETWRRFRAYVRQGEGFYRAATGLPWKSAPLNYYYSFLNLAKALLTARGRLPSEKVLHGLRSIVPQQNSGVGDWRVLTREGVFRLLYEQQFGLPIPVGLELKIDQLLAYPRSVALQYQESGFGPTKSGPGVCLGRTDTTDAWTLIGIPKQLSVLNHPRLNQTLTAEYVQIEAPHRLLMETFGFHAVAVRTFDFFESRKLLPRDPQGNVFPEPLLRPLRLALPDAVSPPLTNDLQQFSINLPYDSGGAYTPMNALCALYAVMFFLSELVRYHPHRLDYVGETKDGWLVESFAKTCPIEMLRYLLNAITGRTMILKRA